MDFWWILAPFWHRISDIFDDFCIAVSRMFLDLSMNNHNFSNFWFFENVILTYVKLMILHNQQAVPRLQIHRFVHDYLRNFCIEFSCFFMFFRYRFRDWFLITFLMENGSKKTSKIDPRGDLFGHIVDFSLPGGLTEAVPEPTSFRASISVACGNSSAPGPREDNLHAKNLQEIWCQVNAGVFFCKILP